MTPHLNIAIGYDSKEPLTLEVLNHSIIQHASKPVTIIPIALNHLKDVYTRRDAMATTEFSLTRFLTPWLSNYRGWSLFLDSDMLIQTDVYDIFEHVQDGNESRAVYVCQHDYVPKLEPKATGAQTSYPRKNWSSVMLFNNQACQHLTPEYVNTATPAQLHRFTWLQDHQIGSLPLEWNWLVGEYEENRLAKNLHFTLGAPCFEKYRASECADLWWEVYRAMHKPLPTYRWIEAEISYRTAPVVG